MIVAIDPSLTNACVMMGTSPGAFDRRCFESKVIHPATMPNRLRRWKKHVNTMLEYISRATEPIEVVLVEHYSFNSRGAGGLDIAECGAILRLYLSDLYTVHEVPPASLKQFATGVGNATKERLAGALGKKWGVEFGTSDEYDAYGLLLLGLCLTGEMEPTTDAQRKAVAVVKNGFARDSSKKKKKKSEATE
jgi:Holliday junction resolvasome RuvABC endonuclease subunit